MHPVVAQLYGKDLFAEAGGTRVRHISNATWRKIVQEAKAAGCVECGERRLPALDFHHIDPKLKVFGLSKPRGATLDEALAEISKCVVLCANCHRCHHADKVARNVPNTPVAHSSGHLSRVPARPLCPILPQ